MTAATPSSIAALVKHVEAVLKREAQFFVSYTRTQNDPVKLISLKLVEVRQPLANDDSVSFIISGLFEGRHGPHKVEITPAVLEACGLTALSIGMGAAPNEKGTVSKSMRMRLAPACYKGAIAAEVKAMFRRENPANRAITLKPVAQTKRYKEVALEILDINDEITRLTRARDQATAKLERMRATAQSKIETSKKLPAKSAARAQTTAE